MKSLFGRWMGGFYMFTESVKMSISNIMHNRLRSFLTILGVLIGVTAVIALITTVTGVSTSLSDSFTSMGADTMTVSVIGNDMQSGLKIENMEKLAEFDEIDGVIPSVSASVAVARGDVYESSITIMGAQYLLLPGERYRCGTGEGYRAHRRQRQFTRIPDYAGIGGGVLLWHRSHW